MSTAPSFVSAAVVVALAAVALGDSAPARCPAIPAALPAKLAAPRGLRLALQLSASGTQTYACQRGSGGAAGWSAAVPSAELRRCEPTGAVVGKHSAGPTWTWTDGSRFVGDKAAVRSAPSPEGPQNVAWLAVPRKEGSRSGALAPMVFVQRVDTAGGAPPSTACTPGQSVSVPYRAVYLFYERP
ncbi:MAG TPA: DUF3455 domain-containing protein [Myxococcales bacterium]|nr:DUF3455 domain-containing protein [Myxococcales bacterium]